MENKGLQMVICALGSKGKKFGCPKQFPYSDDVMRCFVVVFDPYQGDVRNSVTYGKNVHIVVLKVLRSAFIKTDWVCHVWCKIEPGYTYWTTVIFDTLKDDSLKFLI